MKTRDFPLNDPSQVESFRVQESLMNKGMMVLVARTYGGQEYVVGGDHYSPGRLVPIESCFEMFANYKDYEAYILKTNGKKK